eukprot:TRINITY_DN16133_c0_g1_i1.p1 TRINITY_DN16133_c0_g1~~TRINITY_DN16133_c0_g1_i1.p1  ORF type:complete len:488 (-),score=77.20 TRINITY_DN16133_c0_g1_i1:64-1527(-)
MSFSTQDLIGTLTKRSSPQRPAPASYSKTYNQEYPTLSRATQLKDAGKSRPQNTERKKYQPPTVHSPSVTSHDARPPELSMMTAFPPSQSPTSPLTTINSFLGPQTGSVPVDTTVDNLLKLKLAGNNAPKIVPPGSGSVNLLARAPEEHVGHSSDTCQRNGTPMNPNAPSWTPGRISPLQNDQSWHSWKEEQFVSGHTWSSFNPNAPPFNPKSYSHNMMAHHQPQHVSSSDMGAASVHTHHHSHLSSQYSMRYTPENAQLAYDPSLPEFLYPPDHLEPTECRLADSGYGPRRPQPPDPPDERPPSRPLDAEARPFKAAVEGGGRAQACLNCGARATLECSTCAQLRRKLGVALRTFFCSAECQLQCWKQHNEQVHESYSLTGVPRKPRLRREGDAPAVEPPAAPSPVLAAHAPVEPSMAGPSVAMPAFFASASDAPADPGGPEWAEAEKDCAGLVISELDSIGSILCDDLDVSSMKTFSHAVLKTVL